MADAVLFDFFGTLVDYHAAWTGLEYPKSLQLLGTWGHELSHDSFLAHWEAASIELETAATTSFEEYSMLDQAQAFCRCAAVDLSVDQCEAVVVTFVQEWQQHVRPIPGLDRMIDRLAERCRLGVVSNTHDPQLVPALLRAMGIADRFGTVVLSVDHGYRKPHPSIYLAALDDLGVPPEQAVFVGDSYEADYLGPKRCGLDAFLIDPHARHDIDVDASERLASVLDVEERLGRRRRRREVG